jgi:hypothetical protein
MATVAEVIDGPARDWLAARRQELNGRFRTAQRRFPGLDPGAVLALCRELLPDLAGKGESGSAELLSCVYDLILLHAGRGTLAPGGGTAPGIGVLLRETLPRVRRLLLARPLYLPAALSNAVENLGARGTALARGLADLAGDLADGDALLDAGAVLAWRLGEARLRSQALGRAGRLPPRVVRLALGLAAWPDEAVPLVLAGLAADGWSRPEELLTPQTLARLPRLSAEQQAALTQRLDAPAVAEKATWRLTSRLGNFRGFDGHFTRPPLLLDAGSPGERHRFWVQSDTMNYRLDADVFGWVCRPDPAIDFPVRKGKARDNRQASGPLPASATSSAEAADVLVFTLADSFRVRLLTLPRRPL